MEKYALIQCVNGNFSIVAEYDNINSARVGYHDRCKILWSAPDVERAVVVLVDRDFNVFTGYREYIGHEVTVSADEAEPA